MGKNLPEFAHQLIGKDVARIQGEGAGMGRRGVQDIGGREGKV